MIRQTIEMHESTLPGVLILHEGKHGILDGIEDMDDIFGVHDEEHHHHHHHEKGEKDTEKKKDSIFRKRHNKES